jgi:DNA-binding LytR/AlgR family response regulator
MNGDAGRAAMIGGTGLALLLTGAWSARGFMVVSPPVPWSAPASYALVALVAVAGMAIAARARGPGVAVAGAMGAGLLVAGWAASRLVPGETILPPWAAVALTAAAGGAALAGMAVMARWVQGPAGIRQRGSNSARPEAPLSPAATLDRFQVDSQGGRRVVEASTVEWFEANGNYARLHRASDSFLIRMPLRELERRLDGRRFLRLHRSVIVNLDHVRRVEPMPSGDAELVLASGARVRMSRRYAKAFHERTGR